MKLPVRWRVERTFAWLARYRRLNKDREGCVLSSESFVKHTMIQPMLHRLRPDATDPAFRYPRAASQPSWDSLLAWGAIFFLARDRGLPSIQREKQPSDSRQNGSLLCGVIPVPLGCP